MGDYKKGAIQMANTVATFMIGAVVDDTMGLKGKLADKPMFDIPAWKPGRGVKYQCFWKDVAVGRRPTDVITLLWIYRVNKGSYDNPRFFHVDKRGIRELVPLRGEKELERELVKKEPLKDLGLKGEDKVLDKQTFIDKEGWGIKWVLVEDFYIPFDCPFCGNTVDHCIEQKVCLGRGICRDCGLTLETCKCDEVVTPVEGVKA